MNRLVAKMVLAVVDVIEVPLSRFTRRMMLAITGHDIHPTLEQDIKREREARKKASLQKSRA